MGQRVGRGHLTAEQINNHSDILLDYKLNLTDIDSEACGRSKITKGLVNVYRELVNPTISHRMSCIIGIIGLFCYR